MLSGLLGRGGCGLVMLIGCFRGQLPRLRRFPPSRLVDCLGHDAAHTNCNAIDVFHCPLASGLFAAVGIADDKGSIVVIT